MSMAKRPLAPPRAPSRPCAPALRRPACKPAAAGREREGYGRSLYPMATSELGNPAVDDFAMTLSPEAVADGVLENPDGGPLAGARLRFHPCRGGSSNAESANN